MKDKKKYLQWNSWNLNNDYFTYRHVIDEWNPNPQSSRNFNQLPKLGSSQSCQNPQP